MCIVYFLPISCISHFLSLFTSSFHFYSLGYFYSFPRCPLLLFQSNIFYWLCFNLVFISEVAVFAFSFAHSWDYLTHFTSLFFSHVSLKISDFHKGYFLILENTFKAIWFWLEHWVIVCLFHDYFGEKFDRLKKFYSHFLFCSYSFMDVSDIYYYFLEFLCFTFS